MLLENSKCHFYTWSRRLEPETTQNGPAPQHCKKVQNQYFKKLLGSAWLNLILNLYFLPASIQPYCRVYLFLSCRSCVHHLRGSHTSACPTQAALKRFRSIGTDPVFFTDAGVLQLAVLTTYKYDMTTEYGSGFCQNQMFKTDLDQIPMIKCILD